MSDDDGRDRTAARPGEGARHAAEARPWEELRVEVGDAPIRVGRFPEDGVAKAERGLEQRIRARPRPGHAGRTLTADGGCRQPAADGDGAALDPRVAGKALRRVDAEDREPIHCGREVARRVDLRCPGRGG